MSKFLQNLLLTLIVGGLISSPVLAEAHAGRRVHRHSRASTHAQVRQAQLHLRAAGYYSGLVDGHLGPRTRAALRAYQRAHGLPSTGILDGATSGALLTGR
jgi:peptidoglycan hydrolase-like protein with peptidoglycan-binding domain